jgi:hypothetical protein
MRQIVAALVLSILLIGCADEKVINGKTYPTYGLLNSDNNKDPAIRYRTVWGNIFWGIFLFETIAAPIYFFGYSMFEPIGPK